MRTVVAALAVALAVGAAGCEKKPVSGAKDAPNKVAQGKGKTMGMSVEDQK
jgi:hypothetical protein